MKKYVAFAFDPIPEADIPEGPPNTLVQWQRPPLRTVGQVWAEATECEAMGDEKKEPGTCNSITKGLPLLMLGALFTQAGILHNNLRRDLEELDRRLCALAMLQNVAHSEPLGGGGHNVICNPTLAT